MWCTSSTLSPSSVCTEQWKEMLSYGYSICLIFESITVDFLTAVKKMKANCKWCWDKIKEHPKQNVKPFAGLVLIWSVIKFHLDSKLTFYPHLIVVQLLKYTHYVNYVIVTLFILLFLPQQPWTHTVKQPQAVWSPAESLCTGMSHCFPTERKREGVMMRNLATVLPWILNTAFTSNPIQLTDENGSAITIC